MKRAKNLIIMAVVLAVLICGYLIWNNISKENEEPGADPAEGSYTVASLSPETLCGLDINVTRSGSTAEETKMSFSLSADKTKWLWSEDGTVPLDNNAFAAVVTALNDAVSPYMLEDVTDEKLAEYGLTDPYIQAVFRSADGGVYSCRVGKLNTFTDMYYFADESKPGTVYMVSSAVPEALDLTILGMVQYDTLPNIGAAKINSLSFEKDGHSWLFRSYPEGRPDDYTDAYKWYASVDGGDEFAVDADFGETLTNAVMYRSLSACVSYSKSEHGEYGLDDASAIALVFDYKADETVSDSTTGASTTVTADRKYTLYFGGTDDDGEYFVRTADSDLVYILSYSDTFAELFGGDMQKLRPAEFYSFCGDRLDAVTLTGGGKTLTVDVTHTGDTTSYKDHSGAALNYDRFRAVTDKLEEDCTGFAELVEGNKNGNVLFEADFVFNTGVKEAKLTVSEYSAAYCLVKFMGREDQLMTRENADALVALLAEAVG